MFNYLIKSPKLLGWFLLIILTFIWGSSFILIKKGLAVFSPGEVGALRILSAAIFLYPVAVANYKKVQKKQWKYLLIIGFVGSFFPAFLFAKAQTQLDSSIAGVLNALTPLFVLIIGALLFSQRIYRHQSAGLLVGFLGTAILVMSGKEGGFGSLNFYAFYVVLATIFYGMNINIIKYKIAGLNAVFITSISLAMVGPIAALYIFTSTEFVYKFQNTEGALASLSAILILGVMGTAIALIMFNKLVQITTPIFTSSVTYLIPIVAILWGVIDGETLLINHYFGIAVIMIGVFISNR